MRCFVRIAIGVTGEVFEGMPETLSPIGLFLMTKNENDLSYGEVILIFLPLFIDCVPPCLLFMESLYLRSEG